MWKKTRQVCEHIFCRVDNCIPLSQHSVFLFTAYTDYTVSYVRPTGESVPVNIVLQALADNIALEYNDRVTLIYTPTYLRVFDESIEHAEEFIRDTATVTITDNDSELQMSCYNVHCVMSLQDWKYILMN